MMPQNLLGTSSPASPWKLSKGMTLVAGYRALGLDREKGNKLKTDLTMVGPELGLHIQF